MALSAADFQKRHELEGAPDPFPSLTDDSPVKPRRSNAAPAPLDSEAAFPSLAPSSATQARQTAPAWGATAPRIAPAVSMQSIVTDSFTLGSVDLSASGRDGKPTTLGEVMRQVMVKYAKVRVEASSNTKTRQTTFHLKSESAKELEKAKRSLVAMISPQISVVLNAPASTIAAIVGPKGATLKQIRDQTNVKVDIPRRETIPSPAQANGNGNAHHGGTSDDDDEPTVPVTISGPQPLVYEAQNMLKAIIATRTSKTTQRVRDIPENVLPFVVARRAEFLAGADGSDINLSLNLPEREITASGDREAVVKVVEKIKATIEFLKTDLVRFSMSLPKRQHRLLAGRAGEEILAKSKCGVVIPRPEDPSDQITVWGNANDLAAGMAAIMQQANSQYIHEFPLPGPVTLSKQLVTYMTKISYPKSLAAAHPGTSIYTPPAGIMKTAQTLNIDIVGERTDVDAAVQQLSSFISDLMGGTKEVEIDWLLHRVLIGKSAKKIKQFHDNHNVRLFFPDESNEESSVLLVYDPTSPAASRNPIEKGKHLGEVEKELLKLARDAADVKSELIPVEAKWHSYVAGKDGTTLNAIIGEDKTLSIKIGKDAGGETPDFILVRGASVDVDRAVREIYDIIENAKNELIDNSYSVEFEINRDFVGRIVGSHGAAVNRLRDTLGVKVDFSDEVEEKEKEGNKKKKASTQKAKVKIVGRKENVEEAKKRILGQVERLADETSEVLKIPTQYHPSLIGQSGKYVIRLEEKYSVKITFPRETAENGEGKTRESLKSDEVLIKGGRKGVAGAKSEILDAVEFEKEANNVVKFSVPTKSVARILGRGGASINEIKDETGAQIDVDRSSDDPQSTNITCRGTKKAIAAAKAAIVAIAEQVDQELSVSLTIERKFHRSIIGAGGQGLRDLVTRCGGPTDPKHQASLIRFPHQSEPSDEIRLRGDAAIVKKLQEELEKLATSLRDRVVLFVEVPNAQHRALIGRNGQHLNDLQNRTGAQVQFPGSRSYNQIGDAENATDFENVNPQDLVKVSGTHAACEKAIKELTASIKAPAPEAVTDTVSVPLKYHHFISQQGNFFRTLRSFGVNVEQSATPSKFALPARPQSEDAASARIDDADETASRGIEWQVVPYYQDAEEGDSVWTLKARDDAGMEKAKKLIAEAIQQAEGSSLVGFLTLPDRAAFPRIVGSKGANVSRLRAETGADITVSRENNTITIVGSESSIEAAKEAVLRITSNRGGRRGD
ncbi:hypothetical protein M0805_000761 [Coniferiporia weirii]|nr:hypothetical protein M0805_000761 [Coniferiporia weirii]